MIIHLSIEFGVCCVYVILSLLHLESVADAYELYIYSHGSGAGSTEIPDVSRN